MTAPLVGPGCSVYVWGPRILHQAFMSEPSSTEPSAPSRNWGHYLSNLVIVGLIRFALMLPYAMRVRMMGAAVERVVGPLAGYKRRALDNLALIWPDMPDAQRAQIAAQCLNNVGRTFIENYSADDFPQRMASNQLTGDGVSTLEDAVAQGKPIILVSGHYGNYEATRAALVARGLNIGGLYRDMKNPYFNAHYVKTMEAFGGPVFPQGRRGTAGFVRHL